jgi:poly [ADP-ribose] polymerase 6/8
MSDDTPGTASFSESDTPESGGEEVEITDTADDDMEFNPESQADAPAHRALHAIVNSYSAFMYGAPAAIAGPGTIELSLPRGFLPLSMQAVYGFTRDPVLLQIRFALISFDWTQKPEWVDVRSPVYGTNFVGKPLVDAVFNDFFRPTYQRRPFYRSESYLLTPTGNADEIKLASLLSLGYEPQRAQAALVLCGNSRGQAIQFLRTGEVPQYESQIDIGYNDCPLLFLVLEIAECFLDLADHCCICRQALEPGLKPSVCQGQLCQFQLSSIGLGRSVIHEIRQDSVVADLMVSIFSAALTTKYLTPRPPDGFAEIDRILAELPPMETLQRTYRSDKDLRAGIGAQALDLLRWILLSNRSHLISLSSKFKLPQFGDAHQFMSLISTPEAERAFRTSKEKYGSMYLFHGSEGSRWHSIIRNGLKNASGTPMQAHGAALGPGIYFARSSETSKGYAKWSQNRYEKSIFGKELTILALCEVAKVPSLIDHQWAHTLIEEQACICRFILVNGSYNVDVITNPILKVPRLRDVLDSHADDVE